METKRRCETCRYDLGGGYNNCNINLESECAKGGGYEAWEPKEQKEPEKPEEPDMNAEYAARMIADALASTGIMSKEIIGIALSRPVSDLFRENKD